jgi:hypothetical protein
MNAENIKITVTSNVAEYKALVEELAVAASKVDELIQKINSTPLELKVA